MAFIKREHRIVSREFRLEGPVSELVDDYAKFIESSTDHVVNAALKKLWRDQDYRKWRDERRGSHSTPGGAPAPEAKTRG
jgi:hypothetical protein